MNTLISKTHNFYLPEAEYKEPRLAGTLKAEVVTQVTGSCQKIFGSLAFFASQI